VLKGRRLSRGELNLPPAAIQTDHLADAVTEVVPMRLGEIIQLVDSLILEPMTRLPSSAQLGLSRAMQRCLGAGQPAAQHIGIKSPFQQDEGGRRTAPAGIAIHHVWNAAIERCKLDADEA
jgi:hypothetical protein